MPPVTDRSKDPVSPPKHNMFETAIPDDNSFGSLTVAVACTVHSVTVSVIVIT